MSKIKERYPKKDIQYDSKSFKGIGHLKKKGNLLERKTGHLLNDLKIHLRGFDKRLTYMENASIFIILDNDTHNTKLFRQELENLAKEAEILTDYVFCIAIKEMEAWLLGDLMAIEAAYPNIRKSALKHYIQDEICDTWEVLANAIYPNGLNGLRKKAGSSYSEIGKTKIAWADNIGRFMDLENNNSPSFQYFITNLKNRIESRKE